MFAMPVIGQGPRQPFSPGPSPGPMPIRGGFGGGAPVQRQPLVQPPIGPIRPMLGTMHKGGIIPKTGAYQMKKGEKVIPAGRGKLAAAKFKGKMNHKMVSVSALAG